MDTRYNRKNKMNTSSRRIIRQYVQEQLDHPPQSILEGLGTHWVLNCPDGSVAVIDETTRDSREESIDNLPDCCFGTLVSKAFVYDAITREREYQDAKFGPLKEQSLAGFLIVLENEIAEAKHGWTKNLTGRSSALHEIVQVAATAVACLERYGVEGSAYATNDIPDNQQ